MSHQFTDGHFDVPADPATIAALQSSVSTALPADYLEFLKTSNGGEGFVGSRYIIFWKAEEIAKFNREYEVEQYAPGIILFASSGGGEGYGFDTQYPEMPIVRVPFIGMSRSNAIFVAPDIAGLFHHLEIDRL